MRELTALQRFVLHAVAYDEDMRLAEDTVTSRCPRRHWRFEAITIGRQTFFKTLYCERDVTLQLKALFKRRLIKHRWVGIVLGFKVYCITVEGIQELWGNGDVKRSETPPPRRRRTAHAVVADGADVRADGS